MTARIAIACWWLAGASAWAAVPALDGIELKPRKQDSQAPLKLVTEKITTKPGDRIEKLLAQRGVYADGEALGLVYTLNPGVTTQKLTAGHKLVLPVAQQRGESCAPSCLIAVTRDRPRKELLHATSDALAALASKLAEHGESKAPLERQVGASAESIAASVRAIDLAVSERAKPLNPELVRQTADDAALARGYLDRVTRGEVKINSAQVASLDAYAVELAARAAELDEKMGVDARDRWAEVEVTVRVLGAASALRVYYATEMEFFFGDASRFSAFAQLTAPFVRTLPEGNYRVWAGDPGDPSLAKARTDVLKLALTRGPAGAQPPIELRVK